MDRAVKSRWLRVVGLLAGIAMASAILAGCSSTPSIDTTGATIIDVRTASEYADGHLKGAVNIDVQSAGFASQIAKLPKDGKYIVYCKSGARAGSALTQMQTAGFTDVTNAGGISDASKKTGLPVVK